MSHKRLSPKEEVITAYAMEIDRIIEAGTAGDYTWYGLLCAMLKDVESASMPEEVNNRSPEINIQKTGTW